MPWPVIGLTINFLFAVFFLQNCGAIYSNSTACWMDPLLAITITLATSCAANLAYGLPSCYPLPTALEVDSAGTRNLEVCVMLEVDVNQLQFGEIEPITVSNPADSLAALQVVSTRSRFWSALYVATTSEPLLQAVVDLLVQVDVPRLTSLTFGCTFLSANNSRLFFNPPFLFRGQAPALRHLDIMNAPFPWQIRSYFLHVQELRLVHVQPKDWCSAQQLAFALSASPVLHTLTLVGSGVREHRLLSPFRLSALESVTIHVLLESLKFVLAKCPTALLDVRIALLDVDTRYDTWSPPEPPSTILNRLLSMISPTSLRWRSFFLITENPESFLDVFRSCEFLPAPKLRTLTVHYTLMEGYSSFESDDPIYFEPVDRRDWFGGALSNVTSLETCGIRMPGSGYSESLFEWEFFVQLFSAAVHLRHLKLAAFAVLDLTLDADAFAVSFIRLLAAPNLLDLTLRTVRTNAVESLEPCLPNFASLTRFCLHGSLGYDDDFYPLFDSMPKLSVLDVQHADEHAFIVYCGWSYLRELVQGLAARHPLRSLSVGMVDVGDLVDLVRFHGGRDDSSGNHMELRHVRMNHCIAVCDVEHYAWLRSHIADFGSGRRFDFRKTIRSFSEDTFLELARLWPCSKYPLRKSLPYELWEEIFLCYCSDAAFVTATFDRARYELCSKFGQWSSYIRANPAFWTRIFIDFSSRPSDIIRHVSNVGTRLVTVEIDLDMGFAGDVYDKDGDARYMDILPCLQHAASSSRQWETLTLYLNSGYLMDPIFLVLNSLHVDNLAIFQFQCPYLTGGVGFHFFAPPPALFNGGALSLRSLSLTCTSIPWTASYFSNLVSVDFMHLPAGIWPSSSHMITALTASPVLESVLFCGSGVYIVDPVPFVIPALTSLAFVYGSTTLMRLFSYAELPALTTLVLTRFNELQLGLLLDNLRGLERLSKLRINGGFDHVVHVDRLMKSVPNIRELCTKHSDSYLEWLVDQPPTVLPLLEHLTVGDVSPHTLLTYVKNRDFIKRVTYHHAIVEPVSSEDMVALKDIRIHVQYFQTVPDVFNMETASEIVVVARTICVYIHFSHYSNSRF
ncbi:hypothetical protein C8F04DRAFT_1277852 [Mycena alexandri]|uniref:F-box domain-containing protein n=1 Tax=Mycena alexandri TaxID=1745969 RepID=A0AAD6WLB8_9AGAR|nr:hypothetical protein C8F04DRAFT_1277852 [Mycena alexandri]